MKAGVIINILAVVATSALVYYMAGEARASRPPASSATPWAEPRARTPNARNAMVGRPVPGASREEGMRDEIRWT